MRDIHQKLAPNFRLSEFLTRDRLERERPLPHWAIVNLRMLAQRLQVLRDLLGPIRITSGYRTREHNARVGGATNSLHVQGLAADIQIPELGEQLDHWIWHRALKQWNGGVGTYSSHVHLDLGPMRRWSK